MLKKYRALWIVLVTIFVAIVAIQFPWNSSVDRAIVNRLKDQLDAPIPRLSDGQIDFVKIVDELYQESENENVLAGIISILGTAYPANTPQDKQFFAALGISEPADTLPSVASYMAPYHEEDFDSFDLEAKLQKPWTEKDYPGAAAWLSENKDLLDRLIQVALRPNYYHPYHRNAEDDFVFSVLLPGVIQLREASRVLWYSANYHLAKDNLELAIEHLRAIKQIGMATQQGATLVERIVGVAVIHRAFDLLQDILQHPAVTDTHLDKLESSFQPVKFENLEKPIQRLEGWGMLDIIQKMEAGVEPEFFGVDEDRLRMMITLSSFTNLELATKELIQWNDEAQRISRIDNDRERLDAWAKYADEASTINDRLSHSWSVYLRLAAGARSRGYYTGELLSSIALSSGATVDTAIVRQKMLLEIGRLGIAIKRFSLKNIHHPESLEVLTPDFIESIPTDRFTNGKLVYQLTDLHFMVGSAGEDQNLDLELHLRDSEGLSEIERADVENDIVLKVRIKK